MTPNTIMSEINYDIPEQMLNHRFAEGTPLFTAYGCALFEKETAKGFAHYAWQLHSNRSALVSRGKKPMGNEEYEKVAAKMRALPIAGPGRLTVDRPPGEQLKHAQLAKILDHVFHELLPVHGYGVREAQTELTAHILDCLCRRNISLAEAEVGTGKTLAYMVAAVLVKRGRANDFWYRGSFPGQSYVDSAYLPIVVSTSSIALQNAIIRDYLPELSSILMEGGIIEAPLTYVLRKGREHYLCERRLRGYLADADKATTDILTPLLDRAASIDLADREGLTPYMKRRIGAGICAKHCAHQENCRYKKHMRMAKSNKSDFQICNHNYLLADILRRKSGGQPLIPHYQAVISDEGHKFLAAARQMYGVELSSTSITPVMEDIELIGDSESKRSASKLGGQFHRLFKGLMKNIPSADADDEAERFPAILDADCVRNLQNIRDICARLSTELDAQHIPSQYEGKRNHILRELDDIRERAAALYQHDKQILWLEKQDNVATLHSIPKNLDELLYRDFLGKGIPVVLTSGTLSAAGDFSRIKNTLGLNRLAVSRIMETRKSSPFDHYHNSLLYISNKVPFPDNTNHEYLAAVADEVERLIYAAHGHTAVLFTSYNAMGLVYTMLQQRGIPYSLFRMGRGDAHALQKFKDSGNGVLFASGAFSEGIDIPGDALSMLIIVRLPFAAPDPISEYERTQYPSMEIYKDAVILPDMLIKLLQNFGRLIRTESDVGVAALLDSRMLGKGGYREQVLQALPHCRITDSIGETSAFLREKKSPEYFLQC